MKSLFLFLVVATYASAGSIWNYTFSDTFCSSCAPVGFTFSENAPISISPGATFFLEASRLSACQTQNPDMQCERISMYWRSDNQLQVNLFLKSSTYPNDWVLPVEAHFAVPALSVEGTWINSFSVEPWGIETQMFSIVDPESAPEPSAGLLMLAGLVGALFLERRWRQIINH